MRLETPGFERMDIEAGWTNVFKLLIDAKSKYEVVGFIGIHNKAENIYRARHVVFQFDNSLDGDLPGVRSESSAPLFLGL